MNRAAHGIQYLICIMLEEKPLHLILQHALLIKIVTFVLNYIHLIIKNLKNAMCFSHNTDFYFSFFKSL